MSLHFPLRPSPRHDWQPLTDGEWVALAPLLAGSGRGRPPADRRRTMDAIFWIACSRGPWRGLPAELGPADTAHRTLRRFARSGLLDRLLVAVSRHPLAGDPALRPLEWRIARAWRRAWRMLSGASLALARRLGLDSALPAPPADWPRADLSEIIRRVSKITIIPGQPPLPAGVRALRALFRLAIGRLDRFRTTG